MVIRQFIGLYEIVYMGVIAVFIHNFFVALEDGVDDLVGLYSGFCLQVVIGAIEDDH